MLLDGCDFIGSSRGGENSGDLVFKKDGKTIHYDVSQIGTHTNFVHVTTIISDYPFIDHKSFPSLERAIRFVNTGEL